ncbi:hypothetical protein E3J61_01280 [Candidatus Dependentiae bacterium]|nr:MAG: hypothetical protein E3J61_01280 [Candidatus Dependentiae bacterium]
MKKLLSLTLAAIIGLSGMNIQAAKESPKDTADLIGKRKYILPAIQVGAGVLEVASSALNFYHGFVFFPRKERAFAVLGNNQGTSLEDIKALPEEKYGDIKADYAYKAACLETSLIGASFFAKHSKSAARGIGVMSLIHGIINIKEGLDSLKRIKRIRARLKELSDKLKAKRLEKEQAQA